jgi:transcriptional regulator with XRE-family HTH domain
MNIDDLREFRESVGLSQSELGAVLGMPGTSVARIERGERDLTKIHMATLNAFEFIVGEDLYVDFMDCLHRQGKLKTR